MIAQDHVWRRWICVLDRSCAKHTSLTASLPSLPYVPLRGEEVNR
jgi:hypothetical protein